ncbi:hypothetical protein [Brevibacillus formosus]|uniref:hypothetical protein n=1 Tax=Brevibacillus formosus TaxID=54913 RepID=UPI001F1A2311|nr:hypothetical protein [Brevibacillus formosus]
MISSKLHEFMEDYYAVGKDPVMPYIERVKNEPHIDKIALFRDERLVGEISAREKQFKLLDLDKPRFSVKVKMTAQI